MASLGEPEKYKTDHEQRDCYPNIGVVYSHHNETIFFCLYSVIFGGRQSQILSSKSGNNPKHNCVISRDSPTALRFSRKARRELVTSLPRSGKCNKRDPGNEVDSRESPRAICSENFWIARMHKNKPPTGSLPITLFQSRKFSL